MPTTRCCAPPAAPPGSYAECVAQGAAPALAHFIAHHELFGGGDAYGLFATWARLVADGRPRLLRVGGGGQRVEGRHVVVLVARVVGSARGAPADAADQARAAWAARAANLTEHLAPLASGGGGGAAAYYNLFLSYSADFASGVPNPPGSGYHWSLQSTRLGLSAGFAARLAQRAQE